MSALWTALMEGETKESLATMVCELRGALRECGADYISPPCTVAQGAAYVADEFQRRMAVARVALKDTL